MGIVNLTPDSFYSGSRTAAAEFMPKVRQMVLDGADVIDIGACSTRPGAPQPSLEEEWARLEPALTALAGKESSPAISIDTYRPEIVRRAYGIIGPFIVNDVGGGEPEMLETVGALGLPYIAMHGRKPERDVIEDILDFFREFAVRADANGVTDWILDPGFGFGKDIDQNYEVLNRLDELKKVGRDILVGISRKSMIYKKLGVTPEEAMPETLVLERIALEKGATWLRVHDIAETVQMVKDYSSTM